MKREATVSSPSTSPNLGHRPKKLKKSSSNGSNVAQLSDSGSPSMLGLKGNSLPAEQNAFASLLQNPESKSKPDVLQDDQEWSKVDRRRAKKAKKTEERDSNNPPMFFYNNSAIEQRGEAASIGDVRDLVLHFLGEATPQTWLKVENARAIEKVVVLFVPGILPEHINIIPIPPSKGSNVPISIPLPPKVKDTASVQQGQPVMVKTLFGGTKEIILQQQKSPEGPKLPFVARTFSHACPTRAPGDTYRMHSVLGAFFQGPISYEERKRRTIAGLKASSKKNIADPLLHVITPIQMLENDYPLPSYMKTLEAGCSEAGGQWDESPKHADDEGTGAPQILAIDCEMCLTEDGKDLTRICVIDYESGSVLMDQLVRPQKPIIDYLTRWSGITEEALRDVTTTAKEVRDKFISLLKASRTKTGREPILLGHSLESDLKAMKYCHARCIDTALLYHHPRGRPLKPGLAWLTKKWCGREIQNRGEGGHDAEEDARACIELLRKKLTAAPGFGEFKTHTDYESIFERLKRSVRGSATGEPGTGAGSKLRTAVVDHGNPAAWHGSGASKTVPCTSDEEVTKGVLQCLPESDFIWARLSGLAEAQQWLQQKPNSSDPTPPPNTKDHEAKSLEEVLSVLNSQLTLIHASLPPRTAFVVFTGHSDPRPMVALQARRNAFESAMKSHQSTSGKAPGSGAADAAAEKPAVRWTGADQRELEEVVELARRGMLFLSMKV